MEVLEQKRTLTELDCARITLLLRRASRDRSAGVRAVPASNLREFAVVVPPRQVAHDVVTMYSQFVARDLDTDRCSTLVLCYPPDENSAAGFISVLSKTGWSLLGLSVGAIARWLGPEGEEVAVQVEEVLFQPESSGDYSM